MDELGIRLRYLLCAQIEDVLQGLFPHILALPFGSTVNGFGKDGSDLDISVQFFQRSNQVFIVLY